MTASVAAQRPADEAGTAPRSGRGEDAIRPVKPAKPIRTLPAGLAPGRWLFALRIWLAIHLALGVAFWLQLDGASSAGVTVAILALQTRGQVLEKSLYRVIGTIAGAIMSVVIVGLFAQARDLYIVAYSAWLAVCIFAAGFLDGNRAYGAVICGYTVSIVAVAHIDDPGGLFFQIVNRGAAIAIGIASIALVNDLLAAPDLRPGLLDRIEAARAKVRDFTTGLMRGRPNAAADERAAALLREAADHHVLVNALPVESVSGQVHAGAVRAVLAALAGEIRAARAFRSAVDAGRHGGDPRLRALVARRLEGEVAAQREAATAALAAARAGREVAQPPRMPVYRSWESAMRNGLRAFLASVLSGTLFVLAGLPPSSFAFGLVGVVMCLSSNAPDPRLVGKAALVAIPVAVVLAGLTEFVVLGGVDAFPLLMIGTAPALFATLLLTSSPKPAIASLGLLMTVFTLVVLGPSNPQSYDPQSYALLSLLLVLVAILAFLSLSVLVPTTDTHRRRWVLASARREMQAALRGEGRALAEDEARLLDASRIGTLVALEAEPRDAAADLAAMLRMADLAAAARRARRGLDRLAAGPADPEGWPSEWDRFARAALAAADATALRRISGALLKAGDGTRRSLAADLAWAADLMDGPGEPPMPEATA